MEVIASKLYFSLIAMAISWWGRRLDIFAAFTVAALASVAALAMPTSTPDGVRYLLFILLAGGWVGGILLYWKGD